MSLILAVYSKTPIDKLKTARPAWAEERLKGGFAYYREDQNTPWLKLDGAGRFAGFPSIRGLVSGGLMLSFEDLKRLQVSVIAYVSYRGDDHFTLIGGRAAMVSCLSPIRPRATGGSPPISSAGCGKLLIRIGRCEAVPCCWFLTLQSVPLAR